jgi:acetyl esterase/lipase
MFRCLLFVLVLSFQVAAAQEPRITEFPAVALWPAGAPGVQTVPAELAITERGDPEGVRDRFAVGITEPDLTIFAAAEPNGAAILIIPGGGYTRVVMDKEGYEAAQWFADRGVTSFVLLYRLPGESRVPRSDVPLQDAQRAMRWIRSHAGEFGIDPAAIGVMGFSAGGHLAARLATGFDSEVYERQDEVDDVSAHPDFTVLMYPVISMRSDIAHMGSRTNLLGETPTEQQVQDYSVESNVRPDMSPVFLLHAADDESVVPENSLSIYRALIAAGVTTDLHLFATGGHGFGLRHSTDQPVAQWPLLVQRWIEAQFD